MSGEPRTCTPFCGCDPAVVKMCPCGYRGADNPYRAAQVAPSRVPGEES